MSVGRGGSRPWRRTVARVIARDGQVCWICGHPGADSADHVIPVAHGGTDTLTNLAAAHLNCNLRRGTRTVEAVRAELDRESGRREWEW